MIRLDQTCSDDEILAYIQDIKQNHPSDPNEAASLAQLLANSGAQLSLTHPLIADIASTGGPSSLSTLLCPLYLAHAGAMVPKLGVPGRPAGGIDVLLQIPGYRAEFAVAELEALLQRSNYIHWLAGGQFAPLDRQMFHLRQKSNAQSVPTLVAASLLAKKLAVGVKHAGLDIRFWTHGNYGTNYKEASENAELFTAAARRQSIDAFPILTDCRTPYQPFIGRREALLALYRVFTATASTWLHRHLHQCLQMASACVPVAASQRLQTAVPSDLEEIFISNLIAQGARPDDFHKLADQTELSHTHVLHAAADGFADYDLARIRDTMVSLQQTVTTPDNRFPDPVGIILLREPGEPIRKHEPVATVRAERYTSNAIVNRLGEFVCHPSQLPFKAQITGDTL